VNIGFLITARLKSTRLPKKVLLPLNGYTVIERVIQRAKQVVEPGKVVLCTSTSHKDSPLVYAAIQNKIYYYNGHADDVVQRLLNAAGFFEFDFFIGITADNPLFSIYHANLIKEMLVDDPSLDYVFTTGMPIGINIYGVNVKALKTVCAVKKQIDTEIWGPLINRPEIFNVRELSAKKEYVQKNYRLTLDEEDDYKVIKAIYDNFGRNEIVNVIKVYEFLSMNPSVAKINKNVVQKSLDEFKLLNIDNYYSKEKSSILNTKSRIYRD
jgi:spore coat polysaccharide biosynthesis protein SpsF